MIERNSPPAGLLTCADVQSGNRGSARAAAFVDMLVMPPNVRRGRRRGRAGRAGSPGPDGGSHRPGLARPGARDADGAVTSVASAGRLLDHRGGAAVTGHASAPGGRRRSRGRPIRCNRRSRRLLTGVSRSGHPPGEVATCPQWSDAAIRVTDLWRHRYWDCPPAGRMIRPDYYPCAQDSLLGGLWRAPSVS
jgi:hypothetical protein